MDILSKFRISKAEDSRYRLLVEAIEDYAIYTLDRTGIVTTWNPGAQRFKGYTADEIVGKHFSRFYTEEDQKRRAPALALEVAARDGRFEDEGWRVRKDGTRFWAFAVIDPIRNRSGEIIGFTKITRDLTERKAAEENLWRSEAQFRLLVQGVTDYAICMLNKEGQVSSWNVGAERIKGYRPDEIIGRHFSQFYTEEDREAGMAGKALEIAAREGRFEREAERVRKDGTRFWAHVIIDAIRDDAGELIGFAKITRDITERREAQQKLERTREALLQSQKMEAIGQLTGGVAHDFNNLLMAVLGSLELIRKRLPDDSKLLTLLENAIEGAQRGATLTKRMLAFARRQDLKQEALDIPQLVRGMTDLLQRSLGPSVGIETHFPLGLKPVLADANQLEMVLLNLAVNARDAMPDDGGWIIIAAQEKMMRARGGKGSKTRPFICLSVTDTGAGMDKETLRRATEPFFTTKGPGKGTGLGLSMAHGIAEQSGGRFILRSKLGEGTTAELWLPIADPKTLAINQAESSPADEANDQRPLVVLAVDDDPLVLTNTVTMLEDLGHTALSASSGKQALEILNQNAVDLVLTDQAMPNMSGEQLAEAIQKGWPSIALIIASGFAELESGTASQLPKLAKPFTEAELAKALAHVRWTDEASKKLSRGGSAN